MPLHQLSGWQMSKIRLPENNSHSFGLAQLFIVLGSSEPAFDLQSSNLILFYSALLG